MSDLKWFYTRGEERFGPVTSAKLKSLATSGKLKPDDLIWKEDMPDWSPANQLRGLFSQETSPLNTAQEPTVVAATEGVDAPPPQSTPANSPPMAIDPLIQSNPGLSGGSGGSWRGRLTPQSVPRNPLTRLSSYGQLFLLVGLFMVVLAKGCDGIGNRYISRLNSQYELTLSQFEDDYTNKLNRLEDEDALLTEQIGDDAPTPEQRDKRISIKERQQKIQQEQVQVQVKNQRGKWARMRIKARDAAANNNMWGFWRECLFALGTLILTVGLLTVGFHGKGADRWICLIMLAIVTFSLYVGGIAWLSSIVSLIPGS